MATRAVNAAPPIAFILIRSSPTMHPILVDGPAVEPIGLADMRAFLRVDDDSEDELIAGLVRAARLIVEASSRRILVASRWRLVLDRWPSERIIHLPLSPLLSVPRIVVGPEAPDPVEARAGIAIELVAGFGDAPDAVPEPLRLAVKTMVARWF